MQTSGPDSGSPEKTGRGPTYAEAGVDDEGARRAVENFRDSVRSTYGPEVIGDIGGFGGLFAFDQTRYGDPVLVSSTDGAGTKAMIAQEIGIHDTIGIDVVAMSVNDVVAMGAKPLFFLDYIVIERFDEQVVTDLVTGVAHGCREAGCALVGGEIAQHPGHLPAGTYDIAGFCVGVVERKGILDGSGVAAGDVVLGLGSSGLHSNGFSLVRTVLFEQMGHSFSDRLPGLNGTLGEELLQPTLIYASAIQSLMEEVPVGGLAHITSGGLPENLSRILPKDLRAEIDSSSWEAATIFDVIASLGRISRKEMFSTFNMGIGMVALVPADAANHALDTLRSGGHRAWEIGSILPASKALGTVEVR